MSSNATHHSQSSVSHSLTSSIVAFTLVSSLGRLIRHLGWNIYVGSTVSNLIFVLSCCSTQRKFSINPSVDTNLSSVCKTGKELFKIMIWIEIGTTLQERSPNFHPSQWGDIYILSPSPLSAGAVCGVVIVWEALSTFSHWIVTTALSEAVTDIFQRRTLKPREVKWFA